MIEDHRRNFQISLYIESLLTVTILSFISHLIVDTQPIVWSERLIEALLITGIFATFIAIGMMVWAQKLLTPTKIAVIFALEPVFASTYAWYVAGELLSISGWIGGILIIGGVICAESGEE